MNLVIDVGNSYVKLAVFESGILKYKGTVTLGSVLEGINSLKDKYVSIKKAIISSVGRLDKETIEIIKESFNITILDSSTKLPFKNLYKTPNTLGVDRIALVCASVEQFPNSNALIIDAGTCVTYDFVTVKNEYLGGAISPGLRMRYESLNNLTANLPLLESETPKSIIGNSTNDSIHSGVVHGLLKEIDGNIEVYNLKYSDLTVILTGGDANFLSKQLKSSIFANSNFLLEGLNYILQFNSNE
ncbi:type III pantothenate kinase [Flavivirga amylovorans]|uniref:Type III pantothenate kinase n=1 Tax=Flavivirga amylovorans TaxID=870486 RepID=A0ABT8X6L1_9FLAO|nr:type III pantothenate kinase [Flavivirga amylovorans]MDO5989184.1 type III pantothenate kinase [Flavivirga amylovorans]